MSQYIHVERRFAPYAIDIDRDSLGIYAFTSFYAPHTWEDILRNRCTVIVGASGTGKSMEFKHQAAKLREAGKASFFCRLEDLATLPLESVLEVGSPLQLTEWLQGVEEGWFFLDAVDEAKLANPRQFEWAIRRFLKDITPHLSRVHIMISTRPHAWEAYGDLSMLCEKLGLRPVQPGETEEDSDDGFGNETDGVDRSGTENAADAANPAPQKQETLHVLSLAPLTASNIKEFANALGVEDIEPFMEEVERSNADLYVSRPADLPGVVDLWRKSKRIGSYSNVVLENASIKLKEINPRHQQVSTLTPERAMRGAERLAAAATLSRRSSFLLPDQLPLEARVRDEMLDPQDVLLDLRPVEVHELLGRGLFDESLYGSVRFHHRTAREYLTARWMQRLLSQRKHRRSIKNLLFIRPYGTEKLVVPPSLKPVVGWLALWDQDIRNTTLRVDPKLLLEFGDASRLSPDVRISMLKDFAARYSNQKQTPLSLDLRELRRLADDRLLPGIIQLLEQYNGHDDVRHLLLRLMRTGKIPGSAAVAMPFAINDAMDRYSRATAIQIIGLVGSDGDKGQLRDAWLAAPVTDRELLGTLITALYPSHLQLREIVSYLQAMGNDRESAYDGLQQAIIGVIEAIPSETERFDFLHQLVSLLETPPLVTEWCRISESHAWLLPSVMAAVKILVNNNSSGPFDRSVIAALYMSAQAGNIHFYTGDVQKDAMAIIYANRHLKHAVFWHAIEQQRLAMPTERLTTDWVPSSLGLGPMESEDIPYLLNAIAGRQLEDDQLVALSALVRNYVNSEQSPELLARIREAISSLTHLEEALDRYLNPPPPTPEQQASNERVRQMQERSLAEETRRKQVREDGIRWLQANIPSLAVGDYAREGKVTKNITYLHGDLARLSKGSSSRWSLPQWRLLEREFGLEVARAFRDHCVAYWRMYTPQLRSEIGNDTQSTPWAVILGLTGLSIEAAENPTTWAASLTVDQSVLATRYALWELNQIPAWLAGLFIAHPAPVKQVLLHEMAWELTQDPNANNTSYVFARLRQVSKQIGQQLRDDILQLLADRPATNARVLTEAITLILQDSRPLPVSFTTMATQCVNQATDDDIKAVWLAALVCVDAEQAVPLVEGWISGEPDSAKQEDNLSKVLDHVWGDSFHGFNSEHQSFRRADMLIRLIKLCHVHVNPADDLEHEGVYSPGLRDSAQQARGRLLNILCEIPGVATYKGLLELSDFHAEEYPKDRMRVLSENRAEADTEHAEWAPNDVDVFASEAEKAPQTQEDLFNLALARLDDLKLDLEEGDESEASLLRRVIEEEELRKIIANRLRFAAAGKYTTGSEEELADTTRTDIRLHHPAVEARIPIELKIADRRHWTSVNLREMLEEQLKEQYLREARYGVFLLVRRGADEDKKTWPHKALGKRFNFTELVVWLQEEARELVRANPSLDGLEVIGIDLTKR
ncbi:MAG: hypothetical protein COY40_02665 [Alphaproteobacteria bacterium CG_4_10_14_0_8_um_filter_53_9]|nr:MAG: hypothetical protein COY40_02665 [Alphaproteobacteria bacterium CG_4_10_14_0_8_um_filter_53_9]